MSSVRSGGLPHVWKRWWFHLGALMVIVPLVFLKSFIDTQALYLEAREEGLRATEITVGPWTLYLQEVATAKPFIDPREGLVKSFRLMPCQPCARQIRAAFISLKRPGSTEYGQEFEGNPYRSFADMKLGRNPTADDMVWITVEGWDGSFHQTTLPLKQASPITATAIP